MELNKLALQLKMFFEGRQDVYALQADNGGYCPVKEKLHIKDFEEHLAGKKTIGIYLISPDSSTVNFCALDIDSYDNTLLQKIISSCHKIGLNDDRILLEDSGNKGRHIFFRFEEPTEAKEARKLLNIILRQAEITATVELFPKQDKVDKDKYGNLIKLPLGLHKKSNKTSYFLDLSSLTPIEPDIIHDIKYISNKQLNDIINEFSYLLLNHKEIKSHFTKNSVDYSCISTILNGVNEGNRDLCLFNLCIYFLKTKQLPKETTKELLINWNLKNNPPLIESEIDKKVNYVLNGDYNNIICSNLKQFCEPNCSKLNKEDSLKINKQKISFLNTENEIVETIYSQEKGCLFAVFKLSDHTISYQKEFQHKNEHYIPFSDDLIRSRTVLLPSEAEEYGSPQELVSEIRQIIHKYVDLPAKIENLCAHYVLFSYSTDCFDACPYLRFKGDYGTGKSRALIVIGSMCYKATITGGATTTSPIFRLIDQHHGTLVLDEADFKNSEASDEIMKILNTGFTKTGCVLRTEKNQGFEVKAFNCYSAKVLATRYSWQDKALESRCLTIEMMGKTRDDIPHNFNPKQFDQETLKIRNKLLMYRFKNYGDKQIDESLANPTIEPRLNQIMLPILSIVEDPAVRSEFQKSMESLNKHLLDDRNLTMECDVLKIILAMWTPIQTSISLKELTNKVNELDDSKIEKLFTEKRLAKVVRDKLFLPTERKKSGTVIFITYEKLEKLKKRFGLVNDERGEGA